MLFYNYPSPKKNNNQYHHVPSTEYHLTIWPSDHLTPPNQLLVEPYPLISGAAGSWQRLPQRCPPAPCGAWHPPGRLQSGHDVTGVVQVDLRSHQLGPILLGDLVSRSRRDWGIADGVNTGMWHVAVIPVVWQNVFTLLPFQENVHPNDKTCFWFWLGFTHLY